MMSRPIVEFEQHQNFLHDLLTHPAYDQSEGHYQDDDDDAQEHVREVLIQVHEGIVKKAFHAEILSE
ncbi:MAG TPA: hypothetical protein DCR97_07270 [Deltaproteobacteria bacterium]|nr:hypothetical protein [Deltaproteobacteria bacterium]